jgi:hypothetical protein
MARPAQDVQPKLSMDILWRSLKALGRKNSVAQTTIKVSLIARVQPKIPLMVTDQLGFCRWVFKGFFFTN